MAQGSRKLSSATRIKKERRKNTGPKRGGGMIKPKKSNRVAIAKTQKRLEGAVKANIERQLVARSGQKFRMIKTSGGGQPVGTGKIVKQTQKKMMNEELAQLKKLKSNDK
eukprot:m.480067 g.480067  ORF g.480067 m.480067 type:complete len:110 (-) comp21681_c0_seq1:208-537(-)